jgi:hypothetical protein
MIVDNEDAYLNNEMAMRDMEDEVEEDNTDEL